MRSSVEAADAPRLTEGQRRRLSVALWARLARVYGHNIRLSTIRLHEWDLSIAQFDALAQIGAHEGMTQQELARRLLVTQGNITQLLDKMEQRGLIQRCPDGRLKRLALTEAGRDLRDRAVPGQEEYQVERFAALSVPEQRTLLALLSKLQRAQRDRPDTAGDDESQAGSPLLTDHVPASR